MSGQKAHHLFILVLTTTMRNKENTIIIIAGPTASGKTALAVQLAKYLNTSIISADSRQCFRELNVGVAKPTDEELKSVYHYFINSHSIHEDVTAQAFEKYALKAAEEIFAQNQYAVMVGGTGFYIKAFCEGFSHMPEVTHEIREEIKNKYAVHGIEWLQNELIKKDFEFWKVAEQQNPQRLMRALEILCATGNSILKYRQYKKVQRPFRIIKTAIQIDKEKLHANIAARVNRMIEQGLEEEAKKLLPNSHLNALQTLGYREFFEFFSGTLASLDDVIENIKQNTRQYAKRQITWFKKDKQIEWLQPEMKKMIEFIQ